MKLLKTLAVLILLSLPTLAQAQDMSVTLTWDANTESDLAGYRIYASTQSGVYTVPIADIPAGTETAVVVVPEGLTYFVATAYDTSDNESLYSNEVSTTGTSVAGPPASPGNVTITIVIEVTQ